MTTDTDFNLDQILPNVKVYPFPTSTIKFNEENRASQREAYVECPFCLGLSNFYAAFSGETQFATFYCKGGMPPEVEHQNFLTGTHKCAVPCSVLKDPHFHVKCKICDEQFFLTIPERT